MFRQSKFVVFISVSLILLLLTVKGYAQPNPAFSGSAGSAVNGTYTVTIKKVEISQDGTNWVTLGDSTQSFNIASANVGASIGTYISNNSIPVGTYTRLRITQSRTITIKGRITSAQGGKFYYTTTAAGMGTYVTSMYKAGAYTGASWPGTDPADYTAVDFQVPSDATSGQADVTMEISGNDMIMTESLSSDPLVITAGQTLNMAVSFNTANMIGFEADGPGADYIFYPMPPEQNYSQ